MATVARVELLRLRAPLYQPYHWAHGALRHFDLFFALVHDDGGSVGIGETAPVPGYSHEDASTTKRMLHGWAQEVIGRELTEAWERIDKQVQGYPFSATALTQALESLLDDAPVLFGEIPLVGTVNVAPGQPLEPAVRRLIAAGHDVLKVKLGFDPDDPAADIARVHQVADAAAGEAKLRVDANQAYDVDTAQRVLGAIAELPIELMEQPLAADRWADMDKLHARTNIPLMLDEALWSDDDIRRAAQCARYAKFKLMKSGGPRRLRAQVELARSLGLDVVIGNGVVSGYGALAEARIHCQAGLSTAGEMNGFAKLRNDVLAAALTVRSGRLVLDQTVTGTVDLHRLAALAEERTVLSA